MARGRRTCFVTLLMAALPGLAAAQGWIEPPPLLGSGFAVDKVRGEVRVTLEGRVAQVEVTEWFRNDGRRVAEGHYLYPLPGEAVFQGFSLFQGEEELRGEIMDAAAARSIYEDIVRRKLDPALIELAGHGLLRARVFPIAPGEERKVTLRYTQVLARAGDALQLVYAGAVRGGSMDPAPERGSDAPDRRPLPEPVETVFEVVAEDGDQYLEPFSPTHTLEVRRDGRRLTIRVEEEVVGRLSLFLPLTGEAVGVSVATHRPVGEDGFFMLTLSPGRQTQAVEPRDVTAVIDVSGSMSGEKMVQARAAVHGLLETLSRDDRFRLVAFSNAVRMHSGEWTDATGAQLAGAREWVDRLVADGGTNIEGALEEAFRLETPSGRLPVVIFLTDGLPSVGELSPERLADRAEARAGRARVFAFGVGHDVNTHLLDRLGEAGRGSTEYVEPGENVERAIGLLATKIRHPVLTDLSLDGGPVRLVEIYPARIPDVFSGEELVLFGRYQGQGEGRVGVRGERSGSDVAFATDADFPASTEANAYIPRLWASRKLGHLSRQIWTEGESASLVEEIKALALRYGLPSPYTSYLVREPDMVASQAGPGFFATDQVRVGQAASSVAPSGAATGAGAVRRAEEARSFRDAASVSNLARAEAKALDELESRVGADADARVVAGRIFRLEDGVWRDVAHKDGLEVVRVKAFSPAYFRLLTGLTELRPVLGELRNVLVAGETVSIEVGASGLEEMGDAGLTSLVERFRGSHGAP